MCVSYPNLHERLQVDRGSSAVGWGSTCLLASLLGFLCTNKHPNVTLLHFVHHQKRNTFQLFLTEEVCLYNYMDILVY